jgi:hypothetical protein
MTRIELETYVKLAKRTKGRSVEFKLDNMYVHFKDDFDISNFYNNLKEILYLKKKIKNKTDEAVDNYFGLARYAKHRWKARNFVPMLVLALYCKLKKEKISIFQEYVKSIEIRGASGKKTLELVLDHLLKYNKFLKADEIHKPLKLSQGVLSSIYRSPFGYLQKISIRIGSSETTKEYYWVNGDQNEKRKFTKTLKYHNKNYGLAKSGEEKVINLFNNLIEKK